MSAFINDLQIVEHILWDCVVNMWIPPQARSQLHFWGVKLARLISDTKIIKVNDWITTLFTFQLMCCIRCIVYKRCFATDSLKNVFLEKHFYEYIFILSIYCCLKVYDVIFHLEYIRITSRSQNIFILSLHRHIFGAYFGGFISCNDKRRSSL